jgi:hypothetical protein
MANPNLLAATTASGTTTYLTPSATTAVVLVPNAASSGQVFKINNIVAANTTGSAANTTVSIDNAAAGAGTDFPIVSAVSVPANASLIAVDKTTGFYLMENQSIVVTSGTTSAITYTISYESIAS